MGSHSRRSLQQEQSEYILKPWGQRWLFSDEVYSAAVIHYKPEKGSCSIIDPTKIYLCDSGAQFLDGTTDTTRTLHFGTPTAKEKQANTLVLKGNIALDSAVFPKGTTGFALDCLARQFLWVR